tara:strand:+ start:57 stop:776 length:720 start_codon:yes stop_codon:yes gene_type:complete
MEFGTFLMKKIIPAIILLLGTIYFGYKLYLINEIKSILNEDKNGEFSASSKVKFASSNFEANNKIITRLLKFKTYQNFIESDLDIFKERTDRSSFSWESGDEFKSVFISINTLKSGMLESIEKKTNVSEFLQQKIVSDFDLHSYCFSLNHNGLNLFSSFHEIKVHSFCIVTRSIFLHRKGGILYFSLPNSLNVIQVGSTENGNVDLYFLDNNKELFSLNLRKFSKDDLNLLLSTIEINN